MTENVLIAGAGIGGLTAALALHARGIDATVIERTDLRPLGVGINLLPHAVRELYGLGLGDKLARIAVAPAAIDYYDTDGALLFREPRGIDGGYGYPQYSVHRGRLQMLLLSALRDRLGANTVHANCELFGFDRVGILRPGSHIGRRHRLQRSCRSRRHPLHRPPPPASRAGPAEVVGAADVPRRGRRGSLP